MDERITALVDEGLTREEARRQAEREFGDVAAVRERLREIDRRVQLGRARADRWEQWRQDFTYSARSLRRTPGLAATVIVTLALGIGINATLFSLLDRVFLRMPDGIEKPEQLRRLYWTGPDRNDQSIAIPYFSMPVAEEVIAALRGTATSTVYRTDTQRFGRDNEATTVVTSAGAGYFDVLGVRPAFGRFFATDEERLDVGAPVAVVSARFWQRRFGGSPADAVGQAIALDGHRLTVVGVAPRDFSGADLDASDIWVPLGMISAFGSFGAPGGLPWYRSRMLYGFQLLARPGPSIDRRRLVAVATTGVRRGFAEDSWNKSSRALSGPLLAARGPESRRQELSISIRLGAVALIVFLVACANVANLILGRSMQRRREVAVRSALGISRSGIVRLFLTESILLAMSAGAAALIAATWTGGLLRRLLFPSLHWGTPVVDLRVAAFTFGVAALAGLFVGLLPSVQASRADISQILKAGGRESTHRSFSVRTALVVAQVALSTVLLVGAALFVKSLEAIRALHVGFDTELLVFVMVRFDGGSKQSNEAALKLALPRIAARLATVPGVERVALSSAAPMYGASYSPIFNADGSPLPKWSDGAPAVAGVSATYFATTGLRVLHGRSPGDGDKAGSVAIINETFARSGWPHGDALGKCLRVGKANSPCLTIVGIVEDSRLYDVIEKPMRQLFVPLSDSGLFAPGAVVVRVPPARAATVQLAARREVTALFPGAEPRVLGMPELLEPQYRPWKLGAQLFSIFGLLALVVAAVGVFSTLSYDIRRRRHELSIRIALGANVSNIVRLVFSVGVRAVLVGVAVGSGLAMAGGRFIASLLYGVAPSDPGALVAVAALLLVVAVVASTGPVWRACHTDPMDALRTD